MRDRRLSKRPKKIKTISDSILFKRADERKTLSRVARELNISESYLSRLERGKKIPTIRLAIKIAKYYGYDERFYHYFIEWSLVPDVKRCMKKYRYEFIKTT